MRASQPQVFDGATLPGVGAVGFSGSISRRSLLMPADDSPQGAP